MKLNIQAPWDVNDYLKEVIQEKMEKLSGVDNRILHADIFLKKGVNEGINDKLIEIRLRMPGPELFAQAYADTYEKATAAVTHKLRAQLLKKKKEIDKKEILKEKERLSNT